MKNLIFTLLLILPSLVFSQNSIECYNNTGKDIYMCYVKYEYENKSWTSMGWYHIEPYSPLKINLGTYKGDFYIHAMDNSLLESKWGSGYSFCVDVNKGFKIRFADKSDCPKRRSFSKTTISAGLNKWTFKN